MGESLLEVGAGPGEIARHFKKTGLRVVSVDIKDWVKKKLKNQG